MPFLEKITVSDFRNISLGELSFSKGLNCICGDNGQGKTNLLDAIYCLCMTKSALVQPERLCIRHLCPSFTLAGTFLMQDGLRSRFVLSFNEAGEKILRRDDKLIQRISSHIGTLPVVLVCPQDSDLISEGGEQRRRFVNGVLSQLDPVYLSYLQRYNRALVQRNRLLKAPAVDRQVVSSIDIQLSLSADYIARRRKEFASALQPIVAEHYSNLSSSLENVGVEYQSELYAPDSSEPLLLEDLLRSSIEKDIFLKYTSCGVQRDDFVFTMDGYPLRRCGSQGQQKSFLVALKLAQYDIMKKSFGFPPTLLLDDVFDKLDFSRTSNLLKMVSDKDFGQIFLTDTSFSRMQDIVRGISAEASFFSAKDGGFETLH